MNPISNIEELSNRPVASVIFCGGLGTGILTVLSINWLGCIEALLVSSAAQNVLNYILLG